MNAALEECRVNASLYHPNIVGYRESFYDVKLKQLVLVMEYANYYSLQRIINLKKKKIKKRRKKGQEDYEHNPDLYIDEDDIWKCLI
jgi:serine/threonine protein kinase